MWIEVYHRRVKTIDYFYYLLKTYAHILKVFLNAILSGVLPRYTGYTTGMYIFLLEHCFNGIRDVRKIQQSSFCVKMLFKIKPKTWSSNSLSKFTKWIFSRVPQIPPCCIRAGKHYSRNHRKLIFVLEIVTLKDNLLIRWTVDFIHHLFEWNQNGKIMLYYQ